MLKTTSSALKSRFLHAEDNSSCLNKLDLLHRATRLSNKMTLPQVLTKTKFLTKPENACRGVCHASKNVGGQIWIAMSNAQVGPLPPYTARRVFWQSCPC